MSASGAADPLALGQRVVAVLETGARTATYKLATLMALVDHCVEYEPSNPHARHTVPLQALAHRVIAIYWQQVRPVEGQELRQSRLKEAKILRVVRALRQEVGADRRGVSVDNVQLRDPSLYEWAIEEVMVTLVRQPVHRLQKLPKAPSMAPFLYDDSWMHERVSRRTIREHDDAIELLEGVQAGLARLSGLRKPTLQVLWVEDVRRINRYLSKDVPDVAGHLFGRERIDLRPARSALKEAFGPNCFTAPSRCHETTRWTTCCLGLG